MMASGEMKLISTEFGKAFKLAAADFYEKFEENDKHTLAEILRDAPRVVTEAIKRGPVEGPKYAERERAHLEAQFLNLSAKVQEDAKRVFLQQLGKTLATVAKGFLAAAL